MRVYLGIDVGTSGVKTLAVTAAGEVIGQAAAGYPCHHPKPLWSEQDPESWWRATLRTIRSVVREARLAAADVRAIGLSGQMHGSVFLDRQGKVVRPAILWNDQRTIAECEEIERLAGGRRRLIQLVANPALAGFTAPKILWLRNHEPRNFGKTVKVLLPKDDIRRRLTGEIATDVSDASGTLLLDVVRREWSRPLLAKLGLDRELLPACQESEEVTGRLTRETAAKIGLSTDCVVVAGAGDCAAGAVGNGVVREGQLSASIGTSGVVFGPSDHPQIDPQGRLHTFCHAVRGGWHSMGVTLSAGGSLEWLRSALAPGVSFASLLGEAAQTPMGAEGLFFLPYLAGERTPHADPRARGAFVGLTLAHRRGHMTRAVLEGVAFSLRDCLEVFREQGVAVKQIRATGGGAKSHVWRQILADVLGGSLVTMAVDEGPAYGAALLAAVGAGEYASIEQACKAVVETRSETKPQRAARQAYDRAFPVYQQLYRSLRDDFQAISQL